VGQGLRATTWLAPGLPLRLFEVACAAIGAAAGVPVTLRSETASSGPPAGRPDPFTTGDCDLGFLCLPSYRRLAATTPSPVRLVNAAAVPADPRCEGRPVYFAELVTGPAATGASLRGLGGARVGCNDPESQSGSVALTEALDRLHEPIAVERVFTGSHHASLAALRAGYVDAIVVDSNTRLAAGLPAGCAIAEVWGPYPVQPVVTAARLDAALAQVAAKALLALGPPDLAGTGFVGFARPVEEP
jgi:phosphonate transport system substrate-binding protein